MCDTVVALGSVTADGVTLFGKNSDREPNEAHQIVRIPAVDHAPGSTIQCTYLRNSPGRAHLRGAARQTVLDVGRRDGRQRARRHHRQ